LVVLAFLLFAGLVRAEEASDVVVLTDETFDESLKEGPILVEFYAPWCGHCKKLAPEYDRAAAMLKAEGIPARLGKVDCTVEEDVAKRYEIGGFPTIKLFLSPEDAGEVEYRGERTADAIVSWLKKKTGPAVTTLTSKSDLEKFIAGEHAVVGFFSADSDARKAFSAASSKSDLESYQFGEVTDSALITELSAEDGSVKLYRSFEGPLTFDGEVSADNLASWIPTHAHPYLDDAPKAWGRFAARKLPIVLLFANTDDASFLTLEKWFGRLAQNLISKFSFGTVGKELHSRMSQLGASGEKIPTIVVINPQTGKNFPFDENKEFAATEVEAFLNGVASGEIKPHFKSEPIPESQEGPVTILVGHNFQSVVLDSDADVLVEFYAPWCGHCKTLAPIYDQLGEHYLGNSNIVIAKIDSTTNDNPAVSVRGFPTLHFFPAGQKDSPIEYKGDRTLEDLIRFVDEHATNGAAAQKEAPDHDHAAHADEL